MYLPQGLALPGPAPKPFFSPISFGPFPPWPDSDWSVPALRVRSFISDIPSGMGAVFFAPEIGTSSVVWVDSVIC